MENDLSTVGTAELERTEEIKGAYLDAAREYVSEGDLELDDNAVVSISSDGGAYVQMWKWIGAEEAGVCRTCYDALTNDGDGFDGECGNCADKTEEGDDE